MADVVFILIMIAFFGLAALFVKFCERIIGSGAAYEGEREQPPEVREAACPSEAPLPRRQRVGRAP